MQVLKGLTLTVFGEFP